MEYTIVCTSERNNTNALTKLVKDVETMLALGWRPIGGVDSHFDGERVFYHQAVIKEEPTDAQQ